MRHGVAVALSLVTIGMIAAPTSAQEMEDLV